MRAGSHQAPSAGQAVRRAESDLAGGFRRGFTGRTSAHALLVGNEGARVFTTPASGLPAHGDAHAAVGLSCGSAARAAGAEAPEAPRPAQGARTHGRTPATGLAGQPGV